MKSFAFILMSLVAITFVTPARADVIFSMDMNSSLPGAPDTLVVAPGEVFSVDLRMQITGSTRVSVFQNELFFDTSEMEFVSADVSVRDETVAPQASLDPVTETSPGVIRVFNATNIGPTGFGASFPGLVATLQFRAKAGATVDGIDLLPRFSASNVVDGVYRPDLSPIPFGTTLGDGGVFISGGSLSVSAVPEPTICLFGVVLAGFGTQRLRRRLARSAK